MVVLRCSSRRWCDRCRGLLYQAQRQPEQSSRATGRARTINLTLADGRSFVKFLDTKPELFDASLDAIGRPRDTPVWKLEASLKCRSCRRGRYAPPVHMIKLTETREITPYRWVHPEEER